MIRFDINSLFTVINLLILYFLLRKFLFGRVRDVMARREEELQARYQEAEDKVAEADALKKQYEETLAGTEDECRGLISQAKADAAAEYDRIVDRAEQKAQGILKEAGSRADREVKDRVHAARRQMTELVSDAVDKIAGSRQSEENDKELYDRFLDAIEKQEAGEQA